jgi:hypothetical protein
MPPGDINPRQNPPRPTRPTRPALTHLVERLISVTEKLKA